MCAYQIIVTMSDAQALAICWTRSWWLRCLNGTACTWAAFSLHIHTRTLLLILRSVQRCNWGFGSSALWGYVVPNVLKEYREAASRPWSPESSRITVLLLQAPVLMYFLLMLLIFMDISCFRNRMWVVF
jgi:hypothetical protein